MAVLSAVLDRDGQLQSATQDRHRALAHADHLAILHAIWTAETARARQQHHKGRAKLRERVAVVHNLHVIARQPATNGYQLTA